MADDGPDHQAPVRAVEGLMRVFAPAPRPVEETAPPRRETPAPIIRAPAAKPVQVARLDARPARKAFPAAKTKPRETDLVVPKVHHGKSDIQLARLEAGSKLKPKRQAAVEHAEGRHRVKPQVELAKLTRVLVRFTPHGDKAVTSPRLEKLKYAPRGKAHRRKDHPPKAEASHRADRAKVEKVVARKAKAPIRHETLRRAPPAARPSGLMKVSDRSRCGQSDPGAALVCADPALGAADRQMSRAYREARAAGVSDAQQQRWLSARSAAAREAPWAVHDVYLARIAELRGLAQEAEAGN